MNPHVVLEGGRADRPSGAVQDYLMALYALERRAAGPVRTGKLAAAVGVTMPSAVKMGKRLAALGLAEREPRRGLRLTQAGRAVARGALRRRRVLETFLIDRLGSSIARAGEETAGLGHVVSDELIERMWVSLGRPPRDRRGNRIPDAGPEERVQAELRNGHRLDARGRAR